MTYSCFLPLRAIGALAVALHLMPVSLSGQAPGVGIKVHGQRTVEVRDKSGEVKQHREFENALSSDGKIILSRVLTRIQTVGYWQLNALTTPAVNWCPAGACYVTELANPFRGDNTNLVVTRTTDYGFKLQGSFVPIADASISGVASWLYEGQGLSQFTSATLDTPVPVKATQTVSLSVTFSFE